VNLCNKMIINVIYPVTFHAVIFRKNFFLEKNFIFRILL
jgi:hypothetical protein